MPVMTHSIRIRSQALALAAALLAAMFASSSAPAHAAPGCADRAARVYSTSRSVGAPGVYSLPSVTPRFLVAYAHGYRKPASVYWPGHLRMTARRGALAVAMDYTGIGRAPDYRGWDVRAGARDTIAAVKHFLRQCSSIRQVILVGVSMGANTAGLALAEGAERPGGRPLFDWWIDVEGATNVTETYLAARMLAPANEYIAGAKEDIEEEMGGPIEQVPERYREASVVTRAGDIAASGVRGVVLIHAAEDGLVPYDQSREMATALDAEGVPLDFYTVLSKGDGESGTTLIGNSGCECDPFAGHAGEESTTHIVMKTTFARLWALMKGRAPGPHREFVVDGAAGTFPGA